MRAMRRRLPLAAFFLAAGSLHFLRPRMYEAIVPDALAPRRREIVYASGVAELAGGAGLLHPRTSRAAGWWLIATLVAIFPANVHMAVHPERYRGIPRWALIARLPLQGVCIAWVHRTAAGPERPRRR
jgi:uncharacterized membrane protein